MPTRRYTEQQFHAAIADPAVRTLADLCRRLGLVPRGANYESLRRYGAVGPAGSPPPTDLPVHEPRV